MTTSTSTEDPAAAAPGPRSGNRGAGRGGRPVPSRGARRLSRWSTRAPLLPALVFLIVMTQLPFVATLVISLFDWNSLYPDAREFTGFGNYGTVLDDESMRSSVLTTVMLTVVVVLVSLALGLAVALLLDRGFRGRGVVRTMMIAPFLVVPVAAALLWKHVLYNPEYGLFNGAINWLAGLVGIEDPVQPDWVSQMPLTAVQASLVWQWTPFMMLILLAGLQSRPLDVIEAAKIDGAGSWQVFRYITFPHLRRYLELGALLGSIYVVQNFDAVYTITRGGLDTANLPYTIYETFYRAHEYGLASAAGVLVVLGSLVLATFALRVVSSLFSEEVSR